MELTEVYDLNHRIMDQQEELDTITEYKTTTSEAKKKALLDKLTRLNLRLVFKCTRKVMKITKCTMAIEDLFHHGCYGLVYGINKFDINKKSEEGKSYRLSTYVTNWIEQHIQRAIMNERDTIRFPVHIQQKSTTLKRYMTENGVDIYENFISYGEAKAFFKKFHDANLSEDTFDSIKINLQTNGSICGIESDFPAKYDGDEYISPLDFQADSNTDLHDREVKELLERIIKDSSLTDREVFILKLRYGIDTNQDPKTLDECGEIIGVSRERIRQIQNIINKKLKATTKWMESDMLALL